MKRTVAFILGIPTFIGFAIWAVTYMANPTPENAAKVAPVIIQAATPWWVPVIEFLIPWGLIGGLFIIALLILISKGNLPRM